jgi:plasmid stabilization system protein ParE
MPHRLIELHPGAIEELREARLWYSERSGATADRFIREVDRAMGLIAESPDRWPAYRRGTRRFLLHRFPFLLVYHEEQDVIKVLAVAHTSRRPGYWRDRLSE